MSLLNRGIQDKSVPVAGDYFILLDSEKGMLVKKLTLTELTAAVGGGGGGGGAGSGEIVDMGDRLTGSELMDLGNRV